MAQHAGVVHGDDERGTGRDRRPERRAVEDVDPGGGASEPEGVPERVAANAREPPGAPGREADELEAGTGLELAEQADHVARCPRTRLDERRRVDRHPHDAALRNASRGSG